MAEKVDRNAPCPCGSGKKYKKCCGKPKPPRKLQAKVLSKKPRFIYEVAPSRCS